MCGPVLPWTQVPRGGCGAAGDGAAAGRGEDTGPSLSLPTSASACPLGEPDSRGGLRSVCQRLGREAPTEARAQGTERRQPDRPRRGTEGSERPLRQSRGQRLRPETVSSHLQHEGSPETLGHQPPTAPRTGAPGALPVGADARNSRLPAPRTKAHGGQQAPSRLGHSGSRTKHRPNSPGQPTTQAHGAGTNLCPVGPDPDQAPRSTTEAGSPLPLGPRPDALPAALAAAAAVAAAFPASIPQPSTGTCPRLPLLLPSFQTAPELPGGAVPQDLPNCPVNLPGPSSLTRLPAMAWSSRGTARRTRSLTQASFFHSKKRHGYEKGLAFHFAVITKENRAQRPVSWPGRRQGGWQTDRAGLSPGCQTFGIFKAAQRRGV